MNGERFDPRPALSRLKDFQLRTAEYVFRRLYLDPSPTHRFLVADEVGLGKTLVARGVIAKALEFLHDKTDRADIVYICSNAAIAQQNVNRLNVSGTSGFAMASRLTLLPTRVEELKANSVNFVSFTPGTTFDLKSRGGIKEERAILYWMLKNQSWLSSRGLRALLRCGVSSDNWNSVTLHSEPTIDRELAGAFLSAVNAKPDLRDRLTELSSLASTHHSCPSELSQRRYELVGDLRSCLARVCLEALEPDLVILDEFQRFRDLLDGKDESAELARLLFDYRDKHGNKAKVLLLSATPYKMLSLDGETDDDHYGDFQRTLGFLLNDERELAAAKKEIQEFRGALYSAVSRDASLAARARAALESRLAKVMCRTERVGITSMHNSMLAEPPIRTDLVAQDLHDAQAVDTLARAVGAREPIEYWKSSPYLPSFLRRYELRQKLDATASDPPPEVLAALSSNPAGGLRFDQMQAYRQLDAGNARMRFLFSKTLDAGLWKVLWLPPSMPYWAPGGDFAGLGDVTKQLVFSAWNLVPDAIASLCSYEAERRTLEHTGKSMLYSELHDRMKPLLRFSRSVDGRPTGMPALSLMFPATALVDLVDPLAIAVSFAESAPVTAEQMLSRVQETLKPHVERLVAGATGDRPDLRWYWAAPAMLSAQMTPGVKDWCRGAQDGLEGQVDDDDKEAPRVFREHVEQFTAAMTGMLEPPLGAAPSDLVAVLAEMAIAAPGVCALRALRRVAGDLAPDNWRLLQAAVSIARGFRSLFNLPEAMALLRRDDDESSYWRLVLRHGIDGNILSLLDEQVHTLRESLGLGEAKSEDRVGGIADALQGALSIRTAQLYPDEVSVGPRSKRIEFKRLSVRCRFALRFGEMKDEADKTLARAEAVRDAFNSPFRPFILGTTSIGQEGLDFHTWCHSVVHWNLPSNPVDMEQREGRVHRYKGHAVRKNIATKYGLRALQGRWQQGSDPWEYLFDTAVKDRPEGVSDLVPYWIFETEGGARVQRHVPNLPLSSDVEKLVRLKQGLALYRLVFGQPRQEDLLSHLASRMTESEAATAVREWRIDLQPR